MQRNGICCVIAICVRARACMRLCVRVLLPCFTECGRT